MLFNIQNALATTTSTDIDVIVHNENNLLFTLQDESNYPRVIQVRKFEDNDFQLCDSYSNGIANYYDMKSVEDLCNGFTSLVSA